MHRLKFMQMELLSTEGITFRSDHNLYYHFPSLRSLDITSVTSNSATFFACRLPRLTQLIVGHVAMKLASGEFEPDTCKMYATNQHLTKLTLKFDEKECFDVLNAIQKLERQPKMKYIALEILLEVTNSSFGRFAYLLGYCEHFEKCKVTVVPKPDRQIIEDLKELLNPRWSYENVDDEITCTFEKVKPTYKI